MKNTVKIKVKNPDEEIDPIQGPLNIAPTRSP